MKESIPIEILNQIENGELVSFFGLSIKITTDNSEFNYYFTDCDIPVTLNGKVYEPRGMKIGDTVNASDAVVNHIDFTIDDIDHVLYRSLFPKIDSVSDVQLSKHVLRKDGMVDLGGIIYFIGNIDAWGHANGSLSITTTSIFYNWTKSTVNLTSASCRYKEFKGDFCRYSGAEKVCNRSYTRCLELSNELHFGGFRWLPTLEDKDIKI